MPDKPMPENMNRKQLIATIRGYAEAGQTNDALRIYLLHGSYKISRKTFDQAIDTSAPLPR